MNNRTFQLMAVLAVFFAFSLASFTSPSEEKLLPTKLKISVIDELGNFVQGAQVIIYNNEDDYREGENPVAAGTTDEKGQVIFKDLKTQSYFIDARKGDKNNDGEGVKTAPLEEGRVNKVNTIIS